VTKGATGDWGDKDWARHLVLAEAAEVADGEGEERVFLSQELSGAKVVSGKGGGDTDTTTSLVDGCVPSELSGHEKEEGEIEKEEEGDQGHINPQGGQEEEEGDDEPGTQKDSESVGEFIEGFSVGITDTEAGNEDSGIGHPETAVRSESSCAESVASGEFPHPGGELGKTTDETGHTDNDVADRDTAGPDVVHGEDEGGAREREETERAGVGDDPQLGGGVVDVGVSRKRRSIVAAGTVVMFVTDGARVLDGALLVGSVAHGSGGRNEKSKRTGVEAGKEEREDGERD
jgi:hypothetical protein